LVLGVGFGMTDEQIIELAKQLGFQRMRIDHDYYVCFSKEIVEFAKLVAEHERERIFGELLKMHEIASSQHNYYLHAVLTIRARGEA